MSDTQTLKQLEAISPPAFKLFDKVAKVGGQVKYQGTVLTHYVTLEGYLRYVVQIHPQGFQYIASPDQLTKIEDFTDV
jgi:hypothetical protein